MVKCEICDRDFVMVRKRSFGISEYVGIGINRRKNPNYREFWLCESDAKLVYMSKTEDIEYAELIKKLREYRGVYRLPYLGQRGKV